MIGGLLPVLAVPMPTAPPVPVFYPMAPKSKTESGIRYLSYAMILFAVSAAAGVALSFVLFNLIAAMMTTGTGPPNSPDPALFGSLIALAGAGCGVLIVSLIGAILGIIGLYNVHEGGDEFGPEHSRRVQRGLIVVIVGIIVPYIGSAAVSGFAMASSPFPGTSLVPTFNPLSILGQLAFGLAQVILLGFFLLWTIEDLASPSGLTKAAWAFAIGIVGVAASSLASLGILVLLPYPTRPDQVTPLFIVPAAIGQGISIVSLAIWYLAYRGVLERFRRNELIARPPAIYFPAPPYYPGYYPGPATQPSATPSQPQGPSPEGPPEKPPTS